MMPINKKHTDQGNSKMMKPVERSVKTKNVDEVVFFPEKLAMLNALLENAVLLPDTHSKKNEQKNKRGKTKNAQTKIKQ